MVNDTALNKMAAISRCLARIREEYGGDAACLTNMTKQDSIVLNIQRACEATIDLAMHLVSEKKLGIPQSSRDAFDLLCKHGVIDERLNGRMKAMVGFRNVAVHDYQAVRLEIVQAIIEEHLGDFEEFAERIKDPG